ncbi:hypothetical protein ACLUWW_01855 [Ligilactobacillus salivarius]|uniref:hypothetical protein n=1 Tax=Ligilactobacillus salivarius TaxID=1624 RepID=UPI003993D9E3
MSWYLVDTEFAGIHSNVIVKADSPEQAEKDVSVIEFFKDELSDEQMILISLLMRIYLLLESLLMMTVTACLTLKSDLTLRV